MPSGDDSGKRVSTQKARDACRTDDVNLMTEALSLRTASETNGSVDELVSRSLTRAICCNSIEVIKYLFARGASPSDVSISDICNGDYSRQVIEILVENGWDINARSQDGSIEGTPLLWDIVAAGKDQLVLWCLEHGASVQLWEERPRPVIREGVRATSQRGREPILNVAARGSSVATFELLRSHGAPLDSATLHNAVETCVLHDNSFSRERYETRKEMVRHLVDDLKLDVRALAHPDLPATRLLYKYNGLPLECLAWNGSSTGDCTWVVDFLLDHGADADRPAQFAKDSGKTRVWEAIESWKARNR